MDWFLQWLRGRRFARALSVGCGTGPLERDLIRRGLCSEVDAFDGSAQSIEIAKNLAASEGVGDHIHYFIGDFNEPRLPRRGYDIVFFHQSAHHVAKLEKLFSRLLRVLKPDGLIYLDEYVGPSRSDWNDDLVAPHRQFFDRIAPEARLIERLPLPIQPDDPSEALRSSEIVPQLQRGFRILERRDYGGTLLSVIYPAINWSNAAPGLVTEMLASEQKMLSEGHESYHAIILAMPKRGLARWYAVVRYFVAPKLRRIRLKILLRLQPGKKHRF
ncbi:MAG TPA: class I SAM-dependent methyltransferase [Thermoanaerobaculia bacterium]|nr:class I SAM-dependent methyltransferase [Thermoanaerobaculia bacterium]